MQSSKTIFATMSWYNRQRPYSVIVLMLFIGGVESNPGPTSLDYRLSGAHYRSLKCALLNIHSAINKRIPLRYLIGDNNIDILILTETWILARDSYSTKNEIVPRDYSILHEHRSGVKNRGGGIAIIFRSTLDVKLLMSCPSIRPITFEVICVKVEISDQLIIHIAAIYKPPNIQNSSFFGELDNLFGELEELKYEPLICGDFNCPGNESLVRINKSLRRLLRTRHYKQYVQVPTHSCSSRVGRNKKKNLLDLVIAREGSTLVSDVAVTNVWFSDHCVVGFNIGQTNFDDSVDSTQFNNVIPQPVEHYDSSIISHQFDPEQKKCRALFHDYEQRQSVRSTGSYRNFKERSHPYNKAVNKRPGHIIKSPYLVSTIGRSRNSFFVTQIKSKKVSVIANKQSYTGKSLFFL